jgi:hypothetical protein
MCELQIKVFFISLDWFLIRGSDMLKRVPYLKKIFVDFVADVDILIFHLILKKTN